MAIKLALKGAMKDGVRHPSARVRAGAVAVAGGKPVGYGRSNQTSGRPAALVALEESGHLAPGATLYTNTEPCLDSEEPDSFLSRLLDLRPARVVIGLKSSVRSDASGLIIRRLESSGVTLEFGLCQDECLEANEVYYKYQGTGLPFVTVKFAASLDGRIATSSGDSQWISGPQSLRFAHELRRENDAVLVGIGTVLADDPRLTVRLTSGQNPIKVIVDSSLRIPLSARLFSESQRIIIAAADGADQARASELERLGAEVLVLPRAPRFASPVAAASVPAGSRAPAPYGVDLTSLLAALGARQIASLLVEGGSAIITSLLAYRAVDRLVAAIAPKIIGKGIEAVGDLGIERLTDAITFGSVKIRRLGRDIVFDGRLLH